MKPFIVFLIILGVVLIMKETVEKEQGTFEGEPTITLITIAVVILGIILWAMNDDKKQKS